MSKFIENKIDSIDNNLLVHTKYVILKDGKLKHEYFDNKQLNHKLGEIITIKSGDFYIDYKIKFIQYIYSDVNYKFLYKLITATYE